LTVISYDWSGEEAYLVDLGLGAVRHVADVDDVVGDVVLWCRLLRDVCIGPEK
jgi:hypothetical protein